MSAVESNAGPRSELRYNLTTPPLAAQALGGSLRIRFRGQSLDSENLATWALVVHLRTADGQLTDIVLVPWTTGVSSLPTHAPSEHVLTFQVLDCDAPRRSRISLELGTIGGDALLELDENEPVMEFERGLVFHEPEIKSRHVGACIYCRATEDLSREHIVPEGLNGEWTLLEASCKVHRDITSRFEADVLQQAFGAARAGLGMRSKRRKRPKKFPLQVEAVQGAPRDDWFVELERYPALLTVPLFGPVGQSVQGRITIRDVWVKQVAGPDIKQLLAFVARENAFHYVGVRLAYQPIEFARALAKIAYGFAVFYYGLDAIRDVCVLPAILGDTTDLWKFVGCENGEPRLPDTGLHAFQVEQRGDEVHVLLRLYVQFGAPEFHILVGRLASHPTKA